MRLAMVACEIVIVAVVIDLLRRLALPATAVVAYAWHPLAIWEISNNGHVEALMVALMMLGVWLLVRAQRVRGAIAVTLAALAKPYAVLILPAFWRPWDWRVPLAIVATILVCYLPYLGAGTGVFGFLGQGYLQEEGFVSGSSIWLVALLQTVRRPGVLARADLRGRCRRDHDRARPALSLRSGRARRARRSAPSSCCSPPGWC